MSYHMTVDTVIKYYVYLVQYVMATLDMRVEHIRHKLILMKNRYVKQKSFMSQENGPEYMFLLPKIIWT